MARAVPGRAFLAAWILIVAGCTPASMTAPPTGTPEASPTAPPTGTPAAAPTVAPPSTAVVPSADTATAPPTAELVVDGRRYAGTVGGYTWGTYSQSAPWHPATGLPAITVRAGAGLTAELDGGVGRIESWAALIADAADTTGDETVVLGSGGATVSLDGPPAGDWVLELRVIYADGAGDGAYYWHVVVP